jgi:predicted ATPase
MFKRIYIHNFRCLENFELLLRDRSSALLIGRNGAGKSTVGHALARLQDIARGANRVSKLVDRGDFFLARADAPMRFEVDVELGGRVYQYRLALELPSGFKELRVLAEQLSVDGEPVYSRDHSKVRVSKTAREIPAEFMMDWHMIALPIIQERSELDPVFVFKRWLARSIILAPIPSLITGESAGDTLEPDRGVQNLGAWFAGLIAQSPDVYETIKDYLSHAALRDFQAIKNPIIGADTRSLTVQFRNDEGSVSLPFRALSDGEKCFFICALVLAASEAYGPLFCFWDEPDSHLAIEEVGHFVTALRRCFEGHGQFLMTSHHSEAIRHFSDETTLVLFRRSHLEPTRVSTVEEIGVKGDLINALLLGDVEP